MQTIILNHFSYYGTTVVRNEICNFLQTFAFAYKDTAGIILGTNVIIPVFPSCLVNFHSTSSYLVNKRNCNQIFIKCLQTLASQILYQ